MIVAIASQHGAGKSTAVDGVLKRFPTLRKLEMGKKFRELAEAKGMSVDEFSAFLAAHPGESERTDRKMDDYQKKEIAKGNVILDSNLGALWAKKALKVLLVCDAKVRAERVLAGGRRYGDKAAKSVAAMAAQLKERDKNDSNRYKRLYDFDMFDRKNYDLVIDTGKTTKAEVAAKIAAAVEGKAR